MSEIIKCLVKEDGILKEIGYEVEYCLDKQIIRKIPGSERELK